MRQKAETITTSEINVNTSPQSGYETMNDVAGKKNNTTKQNWTASVVAFMKVVQLNGLFILWPASHCFAIMPPDQLASVLGAQQLADGLCERCPKPRTVAACFWMTAQCIKSLWLLFQRWQSKEKSTHTHTCTRFLSCAVHTNIETDEIVNRQKWLNPLREWVKSLASEELSNRWSDW